MIAAALATAAVVALALGATGGPRGTVVDAERRPGTRARARGRRDRAAWLRQAGSTLSPRHFTLLRIGFAAAAGLAAVELSGAAAVGLVPAAVAFEAPRVLLARRRSRRLHDVVAAWPDALRELIASISAGMSLSQALCELGTSGPPALRPALGRLPQLVRMIGTVPALEAVKAELADPTSDRVIEVLVLAHERGGRAVAEILHDLADAIGRDLRTAERIATAALELRLNARAVFVLPWAVLLVLCARPGPFQLFYRSAAGALVVGLGAAASLLGIWWVERLAKPQPEPRVLAPRAGAVPTTGGSR